MEEHSGKHMRRASASRSPRTSTSPRHFTEDELKLQGETAARHEREPRRDEATVWHERESRRDEETVRRSSRHDEEPARRGPEHDDLPSRHETRRDEIPTRRTYQRERSMRPHRRQGEPFAWLRSLLRSPIFAYGCAALLITVVVFVLTIPVDPLPPDNQAVSQEQPKKPRPKKDDPVDPREVKHKLEGTSAEAVRSTNAYGVLTQAIGAFEDVDDQEVSFAVRDVTTGNTLTYDSGRIQYPASSIKAPYTCSVYQQLIESDQANIDDVYPIAQEIILESSDEAYSDLHDRYGTFAFETWLKDAGVEPLGYDSYSEMLGWNYPHLCCDQMLLMWIHMYEYLEEKTEPAKQLADLLEKREVSALRKAVDKDTRTWSKMGWFDVFGDFESEPATVEGGVVFAEEGTYIVVVMTTAPAQINDLVPIFEGIARAHYEMI